MHGGVSRFMYTYWLGVVRYILLNKYYLFKKAAGAVNSTFSSVCGQLGNRIAIRWLAFPWKSVFKINRRNYTDCVDKNMTTEYGLDLDTRQVSKFQCLPDDISRICVLQSGIFTTALNVATYSLNFNWFNGLESMLEFRFHAPRVVRVLRHWLVEIKRDVVLRYMFVTYLFSLLYCINFVIHYWLYEIIDLKKKLWNP